MIHDRVSATTSVAVLSLRRAVQVLGVIEHAHLAHLNLSHALLAHLIRALLNPSLLRHLLILRILTHYQLGDLLEQVRCLLIVPNRQLFLSL